MSKDTSVSRKMATNSIVSVCSYNCRSLKRNAVTVRSLCDKYDFILLQEHWLLPHELSLLNCVHEDFYGVGLSAVDTSRDLVLGRPYGGTAILYRKALAINVSQVVTNNSRINGVHVTTSCGKLLLLNVYMPCNYADEESMIEFSECLGDLNASIIESDAIHTIIAGDFNCEQGSRFFPLLDKFAADNGLIMSDLNWLYNAITYESDDGLRSSWIDHVLCTKSINDLIADILVLEDVIVSDHRPLVFLLRCCIEAARDDAMFGANADAVTPQWHLCTGFDLEYFETTVDKLLCDVYVPYNLWTGDCVEMEQFAALDVFYTDILSCLKVAMKLCLPHRSSLTSQYNIPGWHTHVKELHDEARQCYVLWRDIGKPRCGALYDDMRRTRARFKLSLRHCQQHIDEMKADACANSVFDKDARKFWRNVHRMSNAKTTTNVITVGGKVGSSEIANMWKHHYEKLYSEKYNKCTHDLYLEKLLTLSSVNYSGVVFSTNEVETAISQLKGGKAVGPDGVPVEAYKYGGHRLVVYLALFFNMCLRGGYLPKQFICSMFAPIVKNKSGDLSDVNNYRAIAISNASSKILESIVYNYFTHIHGDYLTDNHQFGFKKSHSTGLCTYVLKSTVNYYVKNGSHVFCCFVDFTKAFDYVDYWSLFAKLLDSSNDVKLWLCTRMLAFWYSNQLVHVRWGCVDSQYFCVMTGVRQGGILSPYLFRFYVRDIIQTVTQTRVGCNIGGVMINLLCFADDMVLLAPTWGGLQFLIDKLYALAKCVNMAFNICKTVCMVFNPLRSRMIVNRVFPAFTVCNTDLKFVNKFKYLGNIITDDLRDDADIEREIRSLFTRCNILISKFKLCSWNVKIRLFQVYCTCFYNSALWSSFTLSTVRRFHCSYNKCLKRFFGLPKHSSVTAALLQTGLPSGVTLLHNFRHGFNDMISKCDNAVVKSVIV